MTSEITNTVKTILERPFADTENLLSTVHRDSTLKAYLDTVISAYKSKANKALVKAVNVSFVGKLCFPAWDTRKHQPQIGGLYSLRSIDENHVSCYLHAQGLYDQATPFALTRSFEKAEPFTQTYSGKFKNPKYGTVFLNLVEFINETPAETTEKFCTVMLSYLVNELKKLKAEDDSLKCVTLECGKTEVTLEDVSKFYNTFLTLKGKTSKIPPIMVHTCLQVCSPLSYPSSTVPTLNLHTAADSHTGAVGDVMVNGADGKILLAAEIKDKITITEGIINTFREKIKERSIRFTYILTTSKTSWSARSNIIICTVGEFILQQLNQALYYDADVCKKYLEALDKSIREDRSLADDLRHSVHDQIKEHLA
jgi:hypothetical protein